MGLFDIFKRKGRAAPPPADALAMFPPWATPPRRGTVQLLRQYREAPWLRAVVHKVGVSVSQVQWRLYQRTGSGKGAGVGLGVEKRMRDARVKALVRSRSLVELDSHPLLDLLERPNQQMTGPAMLQLLQAHYDLKGEAFSVIHRANGGKGDVDGLLPTPPSWVQSVPYDSARSFKVVPLTGRGLVDIPEDQMLFLRDLDLENPYARGTGIAESLGDELETDEYAARWVKGWFYNGGMPGMLVGVDSGAAGGGPSVDEVKKMKEAWLSEHQGPSNSNKPLFMKGKVSATRLDTSFKDTSVVEMRIMLRDFVRQVYGVPPEVLGITENSNRATANTAYFLFAQNVVLPRLEIWRAHFQAQLVPLFGDDLLLDFDSPVPADRDQQLNVMRTFPFAFSLAEMRELAGAEPVPGFDRVYPPMAMPGQDTASAPDLAAGKKPADSATSADPEAPLVDGEGA